MRIKDESNYKSIKIRLKPTKEQVKMFWKSVGVARWTYNYYISENDKLCEAKENGTLPEGSRGFLTAIDVRTKITHEEKPNKPWLSIPSAKVIDQACRDADQAYYLFFEGKKKHPKFKTKRKSKPSFYVRYESLKRLNHAFWGEKIGVVKTCENLPKLPKGDKYRDSRIILEQGHWFLYVAYKIDDAPSIGSCGNTNESLGIDLGIKELAVCSNGKVYGNINKTRKMKKYERRKKREERKLSRKLRYNTKCYTKRGKPIWKRPLEECKNIQKQKKKVCKGYNKMTNVRRNYIHQTTSEIVKTKPSRVVMETLGITDMLKIKHLRKSIYEQCWYSFQYQMRYKCKNAGIEFVKAERSFPSSQICSCCGNRGHKIPLSRRTYICDVCNNIIDRDLNAAINLANYQI